MAQRYHDTNFRGRQKRRRRRGPTSFVREVLTTSLVVGGVSFIAAPSIQHYWWYFRASPQEIAAREASVYYSGCREARAAGAAPIQRGEPGYRQGMDGDNDGEACEPYP
jgi:hypothetical protein